jgi:hypothetical protein
VLEKEVIAARCRKGYQGAEFLFVPEDSNLCLFQSDPLAPLLAISLFARTLMG